MPNIETVKLKSVEVEGGCWETVGSTNSTGYGQITENFKYYTLHRYSYEAYYGEIPENKIVRHKCHNSKCCNPEHLSLGSHKDNYHDSASAHKKANERMRKEWHIAGKSYDTFKEAVKLTGIAGQSLMKYIDKDTRIFDVEAYRKGCVKSRKIPKV